MERIRELLGILFISALIGLAVGGFSQIFLNGDLVIGAVRGAVSGMCIGLICRYCFMFVYIYLRRRPPAAFAVVIVIIAAGTFVFCRVWHVQFPIPCIPLIFVSEAAGILATSLIFRYYVRLNKKLKEKKEQLSQNTVHD
ncbi:MAG: hypothetical protein M0P01_02880 [Treponema sp.]|nr:hypothetical protein [Treponema sp.]